MAYLLLAGDWDRAAETLAALIHQGYTLLFAPDGAWPLQLSAVATQALAVVALGDVAALATLAGSARRGLPWLAVTLSDEPALAAAAYEAGALSVLPQAVAASALPQAIRAALSLLPRPPAPPARERRRYRRRALIRLGEEEVLEVEEGVVAVGAAHDDGSEGLVGLFGPGQMLVGHPADGCQLHLVAHTDVAAVVTPWLQAVQQDRTTRRLLDRVRQLEAWAAVQTRPYLDDRILGTLFQLGEQFGRENGDGLLLDVRLTHGLLAAALGATRPTVTRTIRKLRARGLFGSVGTGADERFHLPRRQTSRPHAEHPVRFRSGVPV